MSEAIQGLVTASYGRRHQVRLGCGKIIECVTRGKHTDIACGDTVVIAHTGPLEGVINSVGVRSNLFYRADAYRQKLIAANLTQVIGVVALEPSFFDELLSRWWVAAHAARCRFVIVLNKIDKPGIAAARERLKPFAALGAQIVETNAKANADPLAPFITGERSVFVGQSGMGKSTLLNALVPDAQARVNEISSALDSGKHTTTASKLYLLDENTWIVDSPGMQEFGLAHLSFDEVTQGFPEVYELLGQCRFNNCRHDSEPGCAIKIALAEKRINPSRLSTLQKIWAELDRSTHLHKTSQAGSAKHL